MSKESKETKEQDEVDWDKVDWDKVDNSVLYDQDGQVKYLANGLRNEGKCSSDE